MLSFYFSVNVGVCGVFWLRKQALKFKSDVSAEQQTGARSLRSGVLQFQFSDKPVMISVLLLTVLHMLLQSLCMVCYV